MLTWSPSLSATVSYKNSYNNPDADDNLFQIYHQQKNKVEETEKAVAKMKTIHESMSRGVQFKKEIYRITLN